MRLAYADPPYPGLAERVYGDHPDFAGEVDITELVGRLASYDGWALSTHNMGLPVVFRALRHHDADVLVRTLAWCKPIAPPFRGHGVFGWEPVIVARARPPAPDLRDYLVLSPEMFTFRPRPPEHVTGAKPPGFCRWLFQWLGAEQGDTLADLYPGSGGVAREWAAWSAQGSLLGP